MGYRVLGEMDAKWKPRKGLEGPFFYANGRVLYYDPQAGEYWDPTTDFYVSREELNDLHAMTLDIFRKDAIVRA
jgi:hypothetical protein